MHTTDRPVKHQPVYCERYPEKRSAKIHDKACFGLIMPGKNQLLEKRCVVNDISDGSGRWSILLKDER